MQIGIKIHIRNQEEMKYIQEFKKRIKIFTEVRRNCSTQRDSPIIKIRIRVTMQAKPFFDANVKGF